MTSSNTFTLLEVTSKIEADLEQLPAQSKREGLLKILDIVESYCRQQNVKTIFLEQINNIKQGIIKAGSIEVSFRDFGKSEITNLFQIAIEAEVVNNQKKRWTAFYILLATYIFLSLTFFFANLTSASIKPSITTNLISMSAWIVISLLYATGYLILTNICGFIFKSFSKYKLRIFVIQYNMNFIITMLFVNIYFILVNSILLNKFLLPHLYPFIISTIKGTLSLNFGSLLTSVIGIIIFVLTTINSMLQIWQLIRNILEKKKDKKQALLSKINDAI